MTESDFEAYRREQLTQVRDIRVTDEGLQSFEKGLVRIIVRSEGSSQELKLNELELEALLHAAGAHLSKKIPEQLQDEFQAAPWEQLPNLPGLKAAIIKAQQRTEEVAADEDAIRMDLQDAVMDEMKAWQQYAEGLEQFLAAAGRAVRGADGPGRVPVELNTLTCAATALEGSADNGDRYAARQIREAIAKHPSPEAYMAAQNAEQPNFEVNRTWFDGHVAAGSHKPVQHRDGKEPWCKTCRMNADGNPPKSRFDRSGISGDRSRQLALAEEEAREQRPTVVIRDSAGAPLYEIETTLYDGPEDVLIELAEQLEAMKDGEEQQ